MDNEFDVSINHDLLTNTQDSKSNVLSTIIGGGVASVVDIGASLYNSLPGVDEVDTEEILGRVSDDALKIYQENPDTIRTISLIGGALLPGGAAVKGLNAIRNGSKAVNWFSTAGKAADVKKTAELFAAGGKATSEYKNLVWGMRGKSLANNTLDAAAAELAILGTYSAHPYMEDYMEDGVKNFAISTAFGGVVGGAAGLIIDNALIRKETGAIAEGVLGKITEAIRPVAPGMPEATKLQTLDASIVNLGNIIKARKDLGRNEFDDLTFGYAQKVQREYQKQQLEIFDAIIEPSMRSLPVEEKQALMRQMADNKGFWGVESVKQVTAPELLKNNKLNQLFLDEPALARTRKLKDGSTVRESQNGVYFPELGKFGTKDDIVHHGGVAALGLDEKQLLKQYEKTPVPNFDYSLEVMSKSTPAVEAEYAGWTLKFGAMDDAALEKYLEKAIVSSGDVPQVQALANRIAASDVLRNTAKVKIASTGGKAAAIMEEVDIKRTLGGTPVKYQEAAEKLLSNTSVNSKYSIVKQWPGSEPAALLDAWIGGQTHSLMQASTNYFAKGFAKSSMDSLDQRSATDFARIYESPFSQALRADLLANLADADGKIYLYRGVNAPKVFGQAPLESMAISLDKAKQFSKGQYGKNLLYKVDVDDIVTAFEDVGPGGNNVELIVRASAREAEAVLSNDGRISFRNQLQKSLAPVDAQATAMLGDLNESLYEEKYKLLQSMLTRGYPIDSIAKRTNIPADSINQFIASDRSFDSFETLKNISTFKTADDARDALHASKRPLSVSGNLNKVSYTKNHANLNAAALTNIDSVFKSSVLMNSPSLPVRELGNLFFGQWKPALDIVRTQLGKVNNELAGNRFFTSADQFTRNMGDIGPVISAIGRETTAIGNRMSSAVVGSLKDFMSEISTDTAALTEFAVAHNINAGLGGFRVYKDKQIWQQVEKFTDEGKTVQVLEAVQYQGKDFVVATDSVDKLFTEMQKNSRELYSLADTTNKITGSAPLNNIGLWIPSFNPVDKFIAYVHDKAADTTRVLWGKSAAELDDAIKSFGTELAESNGNLMIVKKSDQEWWSKLNGRLDPINMERADLHKQKTGSGAAAIPKISTDLLAELAGGYEHYINSQVRKITDISLSDMTDVLRQFSSINKGNFEGQALSAIRSAVQQPKDAANSTLNLLLGNPALGEYEGWKSINRSFETGLSMASSALGTVWKTATAPLSRNILGGKKKLTAEAMKAFDYESFSTKLADAGVVNPFALYDKATAIEKYGIANLADAPDVSRRLITASNALAATVALRFGELAHPLVNLMSMPILTTLANGKYLPEKFLGVQKATASVPTTQIMYEGMRAMNSPTHQALAKKWEDLGYFKPLVSEVSDILRASRSFEKGAVAKLENAVDSKFVEMMSAPADYSETLSRKITMHTGAVLAKRLYPELDDNGVTIFARDFMDKALGNYSASQRPAFFQGTAGMALGLFQTYMLTLAQGMYRSVELKDWKTLAKAAMAQSTIFGTSSLPGFDPISKAIAENFSDDNIDLTTGSYRALGDTAANFTLYGLPSNLTGAAFYTRGDIDPRFPNVLAGADNVVAVNMAMQATTMIGEVARAIGKDNEDVGSALLQALSLQTMSRPLARGAELANGYSITRAGNTVQVPEEVWSMTGIAARILATRPMEEAKLREADHLNSYYNSIDREKRQRVTSDLKLMIRNGTVNDAKVAELAEDYMRNGGTPTGWRSAYKTAIGRSEVSGEDTFIDKIKEDSPLHYMISNLD